MSEDETVTLDTFPILVKKEDLKSLAQDLQRIADWTGYLAGLFGLITLGTEHSSFLNIYAGAFVPLTASRRILTIVSIEKLIDIIALHRYPHLRIKVKRVFVLAYISRGNIFDNISHIVAEADKMLLIFSFLIFHNDFQLVVLHVGSYGHLSRHLKQHVALQTIDYRDLPYIVEVIGLKR